MALVPDVIINVIMIEVNLILLKSELIKITVPFGAQTAMMMRLVEVGFELVKP
jgi:hypothetical protein